METETKNTPVNPDELAEKLVDLCERVAYSRKAENIVRLDMRKIGTAMSPFYLLCTGLSEPHIGAIAEYIRREVREKLQLRPLLTNGDERSHWIVVDYGYLILHVMTTDARERYQLEELWGDAPQLDVLAKLDKEVEELRKQQQAQQQQA